MCKITILLDVVCSMLVKVVQRDYACLTLQYLWDLSRVLKKLQEKKESKVHLNWRDWGEGRNMTGKLGQSLRVQSGVGTENGS